MSKQHLVILWILSFVTNMQNIEENVCLAICALTFYYIINNFKFWVISFNYLIWNKLLLNYRHEKKKRNFIFLISESH